VFRDKDGKLIHTQLFLGRDKLGINELRHPYDLAFVCERTLVQFITESSNLTIDI